MADCPTRQWVGAGQPALAVIPVMSLSPVLAGGAGGRCPARVQGAAARASSAERRSAGSARPTVPAPPGGGGGGGNGGAAGVRGLTPTGGAGANGGGAGGNGGAPGGGAGNPGNPGTLYSATAGGAGGPGGGGGGRRSGREGWRSPAAPAAAEPPSRRRGRRRPWERRHGGRRPDCPSTSSRWAGKWAQPKRPAKRSSAAIDVHALAAFGSRCLRMPGCILFLAWYMSRITSRTELHGAAAVYGKRQTLHAMGRNRLATPDLAEKSVALPRGGRRIEADGPRGNRPAERAGGFLPPTGTAERGISAMTTSAAGRAGPAAPRTPAFRPDEGLASIYDADDAPHLVPAQAAARHERAREAA